MENSQEQVKNYIGYEYKEIVADRSKAFFLLDGYENFGWEQNADIQENTQIQGYSHKSKVTIYLKRNRKIINKTELTRLQRNFETCVNEIEVMEKSKTSLATIWALVVGILGTAFIAGSVFAVTASKPLILLCIILAVPGFLGWILPIFIYRRILRNQTVKITPLIEKKYDEIYEICEKGNKLLV